MVMAARPLTRDGKPCKILHVEDNPENRMLVRAVLQAEGYTVIDAEDGLTGIELAIREQPALILMDINLPGIDGYEAVGILKSFPTLAGTAVVAVTAYAMEGDRQRTLVAGCDGYIAKPIDVDAFPRQVAEFLDGKRERVEAREEGVYLRELNQRLVYRLLTQVEELKRLNSHFFQRARQLEDLHAAVSDITSELGLVPLLERLLPALSRALGTRGLSVELNDPVGIRVGTTQEPAAPPTLTGVGDTAEEWTDVEWRLDLAVRGRTLGTLVARHHLPVGVKADEEQLLKIVANQLAIAVENSRLYDGVARRAAEQQSLVEAGRLLASTLEPSTVFERLTEMVRTRLEADVVRIWLPDPASRELRLHASAGALRRPDGTAMTVAPGDGIVGWIMEARQRVVLADLAGDPRMTQPSEMEAEGFVSLLGVPILLEETPVGVLVVGSRRRRDFTDDEVALTEALATSAAAAIRNAQLYEATQQQLRQTETLLAVGQTVGSTLDLREVARRTTREMVRLLGADVGGAWLLSPDGSEVVPLAGYRVSRELIDRVGTGPLAVSGPLLGAGRRLEEPMYATDSQADPRFDYPLARLLPHKSALLCPMRLKGQVVGGFALLWLSEPHAFAPDEIRLVEGIAGQAAIAIENARLLEAERQARERLEASETRYRELFENVIDIVFMHDLEGRILAINEAGVRASGYARDELLLMNIVELMAPDEPARKLQHVRRMTAAPRPPETFTAHFVDKRGRRIILECAGRPVLKDDVPVAILVSARDITARRRLEERQAALIALSRELATEIDLDRLLPRIVEQARQLMGTHGAVLLLLEGDQLVFRGTAGVEPELAASGALSVATSLTGVAVRECRPLVYANLAAEPGWRDLPLVRQFHYGAMLAVPIAVKEQTLGVLKLLHREPRPFVFEEIEFVRALAAQAALAIDNARLFAAQKEEALENARLYAEASRRRREAEELARQARMLTESLDVADVGQRTVESALQLLGGGLATLRLLEVDRSLKLLACAGDPPAGFNAAPVVPSDAGLLGRVVTDGVPVAAADTLTDDLVTSAADDRVVAAGSRALLAVPLRVKREIIGVLSVVDTPGRHFTADEVALAQTFADQAAIALENGRLYGELRALLRTVEDSQQRIVQGERLRALGQMAGGVAHDFNNVLAIIVGRAEVLLAETTDVELQRQLNVIIKVALDASQTVRRIQEFTRMRRSRPFQLLNLNQIVDEVIEVTRSRWKDEAHAKGIRVEVLAEATAVPPVSGDPSELREALTNIVFNALDAMPEGGRVTLRTALDGDRVVCSLSDTGAGMTEEVRQRVFDPFFTTKGERGTGLGLSVVYGIINRHGGELDVQSEVGRGSTFFVRLPLGRDAGPEPAPRTAPAVQRSARILVIDDEKEVRDVIRDLLTLDRHTVVLCTDGESGLARFREEPFDLVITDLGMPGISGWEVARVVKEKRPQTPIAMVTGWGDRIDDEEANRRGVDYVIAKPFKREEMRAVVSTALSTPVRTGQRGAAGTV
jgi:PAS domain S-box-containing protein